MGTVGVAGTAADAAGFADTDAACVYPLVVSHRKRPDLASQWS